MRAKRTDPKTRRAEILKAAVGLSIGLHYSRVTREMIAQKCGLSPCLVSRYFGSMDSLRTEVIREGVRTRNTQIVAQGLSDRHPQAVRAVRNTDAFPELRVLLPSKTKTPG